MYRIMERRSIIGTNKPVIDCVTAIHILDRMIQKVDDDCLVCRLVLLERLGCWVAVDPVLDYLRDDSVLSGISIAYIDKNGSDDLRELLIDRQKSLGYRSSLWRWDEFLLKGPTDVFVVVDQRPQQSCSISICSVRGSLRIYGMEQLRS